MVTQKIVDDIIKMRTLFKQGDDKRDAGLPRQISEVHRYDDISYGPDKKWHLLDIYVPQHATKKLPIIINIHGGGWCYGTKETYQFYGLNLAKHGFAFINPNYRLAPDVEFPAELDDVDRYIHWIDEHADEYNLDKNNVFLIGDSAGGQMAEQYITILTNDKYRAKFGYKLTNLHFRAAALNSAAFFVLDPGVIGDATAGYFTDLKAKRDMLDTENYITNDFLPVYLSTANEDFIHDLTIKFDGFLTAKKIKHVTKSYGDQENPRGHVFLINQKDDIAAQANQAELDFFRKYIVEE